MSKTIESKMPIEKKDTHIVIKREDAEKYLNESEQAALTDILVKITNGREKDHKPPVNNYYICNTDEPYAEVIRGIIIGGEAVKANNLSKK